MLVVNVAGAANVLFNSVDTACVIFVDCERELLAFILAEVSVSGSDDVDLELATALCITDACNMYLTN